MPGLRSATAAQSDCSFQVALETHTAGHELAEVARTAANKLGFTKVNSFI